MKKLFLILLSLVSFSGFSQDARSVDTIAVRLLDKMTAVIGELSSVSVELETANDQLNDLFENQRNFDVHQIHFDGPSRMVVHSRGDKGNRAIWYNGELLNYYSFDENNYVTLPAPETTIAMIDSMNTTFGIKFPGADLFYPTLTDDVLDNFDHVKFLGLKTIDGEECFHIMASSETMTFQLWIGNDAMFLPKRYLFVEKEKSYKQYEGTFLNWKLNPILPESMFEFVPPKNARLISIMAKS